MVDAEQPCPCDSGTRFGECCKPYLSHTIQADTALALMRSRYSAYVLEDEDYLLASWHPTNRPRQVTAVPGQKWLGLKVLATQAGGVEDNEGTVEFVARFKIGGAGHRLHEISRFVREFDKWLYVDGDLLEKNR